MRPTIPLLLLAATFASAQANRDPKTLNDADRANDTLVARRAFDASARALLTPAFRSAIEHYAPGPNDLLPAWGEFVAADGSPFLALQLAPAASADVKAADRLIFFALLTDDGGKTIATFNEPVGVMLSNGVPVVERSFNLPLRKMHATFGLARRNGILGLTRLDLDPEPLTAAAMGISRIITSSDVHVLPAAQGPFDPFAFGGMKVSPKPGAIFRRSDEVWLFTEMRNPSVGADGVPHLTTRVEISGPVKSLPPASASAEATPLKGMAGHYGIGNTIDLSSLPAGDYTIRLAVTDTIAKQVYQRESMIHILP